MSEKLPATPTQEPRIVSYDKRIHKDGSENLWGIDTNGKQHRLAFGDVLQDYRRDEPISTSPTEAPVEEKSTSPYADYLRNGGKIGEEQRIEDAYKARKGEYAKADDIQRERVDEQIKHGQILQTKREKRVKELEWQAGMDDMRTKRDAKAKDRETKEWQAKMGIIDESDVPKKEETFYPVRTNKAAEQRQSEYAQMLKAAVGRESTVTPPNTPDDTANQNKLKDPEVEALNNRAHVKIYGSGTETFTDHETGEIIASPENPIKGLLQEMREDPAKTEAEREANVKAYEDQLEALQNDGLELCQAKLVMDLRAGDVADKKAFLKDLIHRQQYKVEDAAAEMMQHFAQKDADRIELIKNQDILSRDEYDDATGSGASGASGQNGSQPTNTTVSFASTEPDTPFTEDVAKARLEADLRKAKDELENDMRKRDENETGGGFKNTVLKASTVGMNALMATMRSPFTFDAWVKKSLPQEWSPRKRKIVQGVARVAVAGAVIGVGYGVTRVFKDNSYNIGEVTTSGSIEELTTPSLTDSNANPADSLRDALEDSGVDLENWGETGSSATDATGAESAVDDPTGTSGEPAAPDTEASPTLNTETLEVNKNKGFIETFQSQYGLTGQEAEHAYSAVSPYLEGADGTYGTGANIQILSPGEFTMPDAAQTALEEYLKSIGKL